MDIKSRATDGSEENVMDDNIKAEAFSKYFASMISNKACNKFFKLKQKTAKMLM
jgi:hypothetical protein